MAIESIRLPPGPALQRAQADQDALFIKGPIPWRWFTAAAALPGRALHVGMAIQFYAGLRRGKPIEFSLSKVARDLGFDRNTAARGLAALVNAGLVAVDQAAGRKPVVTILDVPTERRVQPLVGR